MENASRSLTPSPAFKIVSGALYRRSEAPYAFDLRVHKLGAHTEAVALPRYAWHEVDALAPGVADDAAMAAGHVFKDGEWVPHQSSEAELLDKAARNKERASRRARTKVRRLCKHLGLTTMLTLTYRENMQHRERMARDFDVFMKRLRRVCPGLPYVCVFERQKRGAWHAHVAVPRVLSVYVVRGSMVKSFDLLRSMWRGVVGLDNGNVDVSRNKRVGRSSGKLAAYLAKYIGKAFEDNPEGDSYRASGRALPVATVIRLETASLSEAMAHAVDLLRLDIAASGEFHHAMLDCGGYFVSLSP